MKVVFREDALDDLDRIHAWIAKDNPPAAAAMVSRIRDRIAFLELDSLAQMGRPGVVPGTRELIENPYIIVYKVDEQRREVVVLAIFHGAQNRGLQSAAVRLDLANLFTTMSRFSRER
jgi:addiction module RelE/StbE family toxin